MFQGAACGTHIKINNKKKERREEKENGHETTRKIYTISYSLCNQIWLRESERGVRGKEEAFASIVILSSFF